MTEITLPRLSDSMEEGTILSWLKADGDTVAAGEELVEIETDKATMTYEAPADGTLAIVAAAGETLPVGAPIARIGAQDGVVTTAPAVDPPTPKPERNGAVTATPVARRLAGAHGIDLATLSGSGPRGRVTRADVAAAAGLAIAPEPEPAPAAPPVPDDSEPRELTRLQQVVARRMTEAKATVPEFQVQTEVDMDVALDFRARLKQAAPDAPSVNDLIVKASALALRAHPLANGSYRDGRFALHRRVNIGVAVAAAEALLVATVNDADTLSLRAIAAETRRLAERARDGSITPAELSGATFTVSNLGMYGMTAITPVINPPQAAILGVGATRDVLARDADGEIVDRRRMTLTLTCDHRILYGADAARFLAAIRELLEQPLRLV
jgi:pyruvate dehydrogenase E2 component (dihydrolipoamide acetyltransferase)